MSVRIYREKHASLEPLRGKVCSVIGFGSQGHAHALNLWDNGLNVVVGLPPGSKSRAVARANGLKVCDTADATRQGNAILLALPDSQMPAIYEREIAPQLKAGQALLFAHGFAIYYRTIVPPKNVDVIMVAPLGLGTMVRREFVEGRGVPALLAVHQVATKNARKIALAWAKGIGATRAGAIATTFRDETETDLFSEQAVLCGGMSALVQTGFETLVEAGYPPELAYYECLHELKFIVDLMHESGLRGMRALISETARWGDLTVGPKIIGPDVKREMAAALRRIRSGQFAREWIHETESGRKRLAALSRKAATHRIEKVGNRLRGLMAWKNAGNKNSPSRPAAGLKPSRR
jgi:ketol-acid reductoisomerase